MKRARILLLPAAAAVITVLCVYATTRQERSYKASSLDGAARQQMGHAPLFELYDQQQPSRRVRLVSFVGRHPIIVVFFDGQQGADKSSALARLKQEYDRRKSANTIVLAVSDALPQENRKTEERSGPFPFPLLSDPDYAVHRLWGRIDKQTGRPLSGMFLIDRAGRVAWSEAAPQPVDDSNRTIDRLIEGR